MSENVKYCWDEFTNWCKDNGVGLEYKEDWEAWWGCWKTAIDKKIESEPARLR